MNFRWRCKHTRVRCVHDAKIGARNFRFRSVCVDCGKGFPDLPATCSVTMDTTHPFMDDYPMV